MTSNTTLSHDPAELGELERAVLELIWEHGVQNAEQVREQLARQNRPLKETTIRTVLRRLEAKGYVEHLHGLDMSCENLFDLGGQPTSKSHSR